MMLDLDEQLKIEKFLVPGFKIGVLELPVAYGRIINPEDQKIDLKNNRLAVNQIIKEFKIS
jgi:hypothetical protein